MKSNLEIFDFEISKEDMEKLLAMDKNITSVASMDTIA